MSPYRAPRPGLTYATVEKRREKGRVAEILTRVIFGTIAAVVAALARPGAGRTINTSFIERHNGTDRHRNARKARKSYCFSKDWSAHQAITYFTMSSSNFCWPVRTLRAKGEGGAWQRRTPAMAAGLTDHRWTMRELLSQPIPLPPWVAPKRRGRPPKREQSVMRAAA